MRFGGLVARVAWRLRFRVKVVRQQVIDAGGALTAGSARAIAASGRFEIVAFGLALGKSAHRVQVSEKTALVDVEVSGLQRRLDAALQVEQARIVNAGNLARIVEGVSAVCIDGKQRPHVHIGGGKIDVVLLAGRRLQLRAEILAELSRESQ